MMRTSVTMALAASAGLFLVGGFWPDAAGVRVGGLETAAVYGGAQIIPPCPKDAPRVIPDKTKPVCDSKANDTCSGAKPPMNNCGQVNLGCGFKCTVVVFDATKDPKGLPILVDTPTKTCAQLGAGALTMLCQWDPGKGTCVCSQQLFVGVLCTPDPKLTGDVCAPPPSK